jgi:hypothetical protein
MPLGTKTTSGHTYLHETLAFLDLPGTTRNEVVATLGPPAYESESTRTLLYVWERTFRWSVSRPEQIGPVHLTWEHNPEVIAGKQRLWGLFIAYDEQGLVCAHEIRTFGAPRLEEACVSWRSSRAPKR